MDNETRIKITDPEVPEGPAGKVGKKILLFTVLSAVALIIIGYLTRNRITIATALGKLHDAYDGHEHGPR